MNNLLTKLHLSKGTSATKRLGKPALYHPSRDWQIMLCIVALILMAAILGYFWLNREVNKTPEISNTPTDGAMAKALTREEIVKYANEIK
jgi:hypothetical protein